MKIYISGKISGTDDYIKRFNCAEEELKEKGWEVINPTKMEAIMPKDATWSQYMKIDLCLLDLCDAIYMLKDWRTSTGASIEYGYALAKDMVIMQE